MAIFFVVFSVVGLTAPVWTDVHSAPLSMSRDVQVENWWQDCPYPDVTYLSRD